MLKAALVIIYMSLYVPSAVAGERFKNSEHCQVLLYRGNNNGGTVFWINLPKLGPVLLTQLHVIQNIKGDTFLSYGLGYGPFFYEFKNIANAWKESYSPEIIWQNEEMDAAILRPNDKVLERLKNCPSFSWTENIPSEGKLVGYPIIGRRTYPLTSKISISIGNMLSRVVQKESYGNSYLDGDGLIYSDADSILGNSGGPFIDLKGNVVGLFHKTVNSWYGNGYKYNNPQSSILPIKNILKEIGVLL